MSSWRTQPLFDPQATPESGTSASRRDGKSIALGTNAASREDDGPTLDAANQSLADALRLIFVLLNVSLLAIAAAYVLSGFQQVGEGQSGIRLLFGRVQSSGLEPGFRFAAPYPIGDLMKIDTGNQKLELLTEFWPYVEGDQVTKQVSELPGNPALKPERDGSLITADLNLAHTRCNIIYVRADPTKYATNIYPGTNSDAPRVEDKKIPHNEHEIVKHAVARGIVQAMASTELDAFVKQADADMSSVAARARQIAQDSLDRMDSGLKIEKLGLEGKSPPSYTTSSFQGVQAAEQNAGKKRDEALRYRQTVLSSVAGGAADIILAQIDAYDRAIELKDEAAQKLAMDRLDRLFLGEEVVIPTPSPEDKSKFVDVKYVRDFASGEITTIRSEARQYRSLVVNKRQAEAGRFTAKLAQFKSNPLLTVHREWSDAYTAFINHDNIFKLYVPRGVNTLNLAINPDPDIIRNIVKARQMREAEAAEAKRMHDFNRTKYQPATGLQQTPGS